MCITTQTKIGQGETASPMALNHILQCSIVIYMDVSLLEWKLLDIRDGILFLYLTPQLTLCLATTKMFQINI